MGLTYSEISLENSFTKHRMDVRALAIFVLKHNAKN